MMKSDMPKNIHPEVIEALIDQFKTVTTLSQMLKGLIEKENFTAASAIGEQLHSEVVEFKNFVLGLMPVAEKPKVDDKVNAVQAPVTEVAPAAT